MRLLSMQEHPSDVQLAPVRKRKDGEDPLGAALCFKALLNWPRHKQGFSPEYLTDGKENYPEMQKYVRHQIDFSDA